AWGSTCFEDQDAARQGRKSLEEDIKGAIVAPTICQPIQDKWEGFNCPLASLPPLPCVLVRRAYVDTMTVPTGKVPIQIAEPGSKGDRLLDAFCKMYSLHPQTKSGQQMRVGMTRLGGQAATGCSILFGTNVAFGNLQRGQEEIWIDHFSLETVGAL